MGATVNGDAVTSVEDASLTSETANEETIKRYGHQRRGYGWTDECANSGITINQGAVTSAKNTGSTNEPADKRINQRRCHPPPLAHAAYNLGPPAGPAHVACSLPPPTLSVHVACPPPPVWGACPPTLPADRAPLTHYSPVLQHFQNTRRMSSTKALTSCALHPSTHVACCLYNPYDNKFGIRVRAKILRPM